MLGSICKRLTVGSSEDITSVRVDDSTERINDKFEDAGPRYLGSSLVRTHTLYCIAI